MCIFEAICCFNACLLSLDIKAVPCPMIDCIVTVSLNIIAELNHVIDWMIFWCWDTSLKQKMAKFYNTFKENNLILWSFQNVFET